LREEREIMKKIIVRIIEKDENENILEAVVESSEAKFLKPEEVIDQFMIDMFTNIAVFFDVNEEPIAQFGKVPE
jgi:hypothetical protein